MKKVFKIFGSVLAIVVFLVIAIGTQEVDEPHSLVTNIEVRSDSKLINGELEEGYTITFTLINTGVQGSISVIVKLSCSEGQWTRNETLTLDAEEKRKLNYFFHEPAGICEDLKGKVEAEP